MVGLTHVLAPPYHWHSAPFAPIMIMIRKACASVLTWLTSHYCRRALCRVLRALGKAPIALGKGFAECRTRQRAAGKEPVGKGFFTECHISGIR